MATPGVLARRMLAGMPPLDPQGFVAELRKRLDDRCFVTDPEPHLVDWPEKIRGTACAVLAPGTTQDVVDIVRAAGKFGVALVPQGGNTGLCGGSIPDSTGQQAVVHMGRMNAVRSVSPDTNLLTAEAGVVLAEAQNAAEAVDRFFPLSLAAEGSCQIGGVVSTNAGGTGVLRYGNTRDLVLGLEVVLPSGDVLSDLRGLHKNNTGYDLKQLYIGAEGTLGIVTAATLKLFPAIRTRATAFVALADFDAAVRCLRRVQERCGDAVSAAEVMSKDTMRLALDTLSNLRAPLSPLPPYALLLELSSSNPDQDLDGVLGEVLEDDVESGEILDAAVALDPGQRAGFWRLREEMGAVERQTGGTIKSDISLPLDALGAFVFEAQAAIAAAFPDAEVLNYGHVGDGGLHYNVRFPKRQPEALISLADGVYDVINPLVLKLGGSFSAEHGIGTSKRHEMLKYKDPVALQLMRTLKTVLDPNVIMNPGKVI